MGKALSFRSGAFDVGPLSNTDPTESEDCSSFERWSMNLPSVRSSGQPPGRDVATGEWQG